MTHGQKMRRFYFAFSVIYSLFALNSATSGHYLVAIALVFFAAFFILRGISAGNRDDRQ